MFNIIFYTKSSSKKNFLGSSHHNFETIFLEITTSKHSTKKSEIKKTKDLCDSMQLTMLIKEKDKIH